MDRQFQWVALVTRLGAEVPLTEEDWWIFVNHRGDPFRAYRMGCAFVRSRQQDRRDADRMLRIMTLGCRFCGSNSMWGEIHEKDCIYATDPSARRVWLRKGARIIE